MFWPLCVLCRKHLEDASGKKQALFNIYYEIRDHKEAILARATAQAKAEDAAQQVARFALLALIAHNC